MHSISFSSNRRFYMSLTENPTQFYPLLSTLSTILVEPSDIEPLLRSLPLGKAVGPDLINNRILKEVSSQLSAPLSELFNYSLSLGVFPGQWKLANICPVYKKDETNLVSNYRPISLLCSLSKVFEKAVYKHLYNHLLDNNILTDYQSGFRQGDSTINQLSTLYNSFCDAVDSGKEIRVVFCDISKAFDRVWHKGLVSKLHSVGVRGILLQWFQSYLSDRQQRVTIQGSSSSLLYIKAGVPQGSILGPLLFLIFINDIVTDIDANIRLFADDTSLSLIVDSPMNTALVLNSDLDKISRWAQNWLVTFNPAKTVSMTISRKPVKVQHPPLLMQNHVISELSSHKHLGVFLSADCSWSSHIEYTKKKAWLRINILRSLKFVLDRRTLKILYLTFIRPLLEYGDILFDNCSARDKHELDMIQNEAARIVTGATRLVSLDKLYNDLCWESLSTRRLNHKLVFIYKIRNGMSPAYLSSILPLRHTDRYNFRNSLDIPPIHCRTSFYLNSLIPSSIRSWNALPHATKTSDSVQQFKRLISNNSKTPSYFLTGPRKLQVLHTRLRLGCSSLNEDLFRKNIIPSNLCTCGQTETVNHFLLTCPLYGVQRHIMLSKISQLDDSLTITSKLLLFGSGTLPDPINYELFRLVYSFIDSTKRFH